MGQSFPQDDKVIAISGLGSCSPLGALRDEVLACYKEGKSRIITRAVDGRPTPVAPLAPSAEEELEQLISTNARYARLDRSTLLAICSARKAVACAGWITGAEGIGVCLGSSRGATGLFERYHKSYLESERARVPILTSPTTTLGNISSWVAQDLGTTGVACSTSSTCSSSLVALANGFAWLKAGLAERFLAGGSEAPLTPFTIAQMRALRIYSADGDPFPCRPFSTEIRRKDALVLGEGACVFALDNISRSAAQGALAVLESVGHHIEPITNETAISASGEALLGAMKCALDRMPSRDEIDLIVTHAPGTLQGESAEIAAIDKLFPGGRPVIASNKWCIGHTFGASGALSLEYALLLLSGELSPNFPYAVDLCPYEAQRIRRIMVNSTGFGGAAMSVIISAAGKIYW